MVFELLRQILANKTQSHVIIWKPRKGWNKIKSGP
mgnify:CR=1 FL=1